MPRRLDLTTGDVDGPADLADRVEDVSFDMIYRIQSNFGGLRSRRNGRRLRTYLGTWVRDAASRESFEYQQQALCKDGWLYDRSGHALNWRAGVAESNRGRYTSEDATTMEALAAVGGLAATPVLVGKSPSPAGAQTACQSRQFGLA